MNFLEITGVDPVGIEILRSNGLSDDDAVRPVRPVHYRAALKVLPSAVVAVCSTDPVSGEPHGVLVDNFGMLSEDPPLVSFSIGRASKTWRPIAASGRFTASILEQGQRMVWRSFASRGKDKFHWVAWEASFSGAPRIRGAAAWLDCRILRVFDGGDHLIVVAAPEEIATGTGTALVSRLGRLI